MPEQLRSFSQKTTVFGTFWFLSEPGEKSESYLRGQYNHVGDCVWLRSFHSVLLCVQGVRLTKIFAKSTLEMVRNLGLRRTRYVDGNTGGFGSHRVFTLKVI